MANKKPHGYDGLLIVVEGTDGSGKSTQVNMLSQYIKDECYGCIVSEWKTSRLISGVINDAKERNMLNTTTYSLLYAADYADRLENNIIPALKAGFVVLMDRYIYTAYVRDSVRGHDIKWVKELYSFAPKPDLVFYLNVAPDILIKRLIKKNGALDYFESGRDIGLSTDTYNSFEIYQKRCLDEYKKLQKEYKFIELDGTQSQDVIHNEIKTRVQELLKSSPIK
ncbi:MAG: dTMP kinase [Candidatus Gastranaerophilales bacterium]|nr:dTMP kinase [Candidatus Gastranaerophilales bacterium]